MHDIEERADLVSAANAANRLTEPNQVSRFAALATPAQEMSDALIAAINRCCDARRDDAKNRAELIAECGRLPVHGQADALVHFQTQAVIWEKANRGEAP